MEAARATKPSSGWNANTTSWRAGPPAPAAGAGRQHALVLREAARPVHPVPLVEGVERVEEGLERDGRAYALCRLLVVEQRIERGEAQLVKQEARRHDGEVQALMRNTTLAGDLLLPGVIAAHEQPPAERLTTREAIDPGDGVAVPLVAWPPLPELLPPRLLPPPVPLALPALLLPADGLPPDAPLPLSPSGSKNASPLPPQEKTSTERPSNPKMDFIP